MNPTISLVTKVEVVTKVATVAGVAAMDGAATVDRVEGWIEPFGTRTSLGSGENSVHTIRKGHKHGLFSMTCFLLLARLEFQPRGGFQLYPWCPNAHGL